MNERAKEYLAWEWAACGSTVSMVLYHKGTASGKRTIRIGVQRALLFYNFLGFQGDKLAMRECKDREANDSLRATE